MKVDLNVDVHHLARVEGHGNIHVQVRDGQLVEARWEVVETPRYFEVMLRGKHFSSAAQLTARICGICSIGHALCSLRATEHAMGIVTPPLADTLRLLAKHGETLQSHYLHLFFLAAPDFLGLPSALPLQEKNPEVFHLARQLKGMANQLCDVIAGRTTHPVSLVPGGVARRPDGDTLKRLRDQLESSLADLEATVVGLFSTFAIPDFVRETEWVSLKGTASFPWIGGDLVSSDGVLKQEPEYLAMTNEVVTDDNTSKWCSLSRPSFGVGALARINNNFALLHDEARQTAAVLGLKPVCHNPYMNSVAQLVECVHVTHDTIRLIDEVLANPRGEIQVPVQPRAGRGVGAVEVPRGILYHCYEIDGEGCIQKADCVIPTTQNNKNIHLDLQALAPWLAGQGVDDSKATLLCEMLVRAYDPCISCSVH
ncbi:MAG: Ni/Fe hydrogenase subunit alpha [Pseudomonadota bacterium]